MTVQHALVLERIEIMIPVTMIKPIPTSDNTACHQIHTQTLAEGHTHPRVR